MEYDQQNNLEKLLRLASEDFSNETELLEALLTSQIYVLGQIIEKENQIVSVREAPAMQLEFWEVEGIKFIPAFSSINSLNRSVESDLPYEAVLAIDLLEVAQGNYIYLNPKSEYGLLLDPKKIQDICNSGDIYTINKSRDVNSNVTIFIPENYPIAIAEELTKLFSKDSNFKQAFLVGIKYGSTTEEQHIMIILDTNDYTKEVRDTVGHLALEIGKKEYPGIVINVADLHGIGNEAKEYVISNIAPFYKHDRDFKE